jgi:FkbH-like protein
LESINIAVGTVAKAVPLPSLVRRRALGKLSYIRRNQLTKRNGRDSEQPDYFVVEVYNPSKRSVRLTLTIRSSAAAHRAMFQRLIRVEPGLTREKFAYHEIRSIVDTDRAFEVELVPNDAESLTLYFGLIDFVQETTRPPKPGPAVQDRGKKCKCVIWDLDNTLWDGVLIEDGPERIAFHAELKGVIEELDRRGVLQSIASKNNVDEALAALERFGIKEYFLYPQVHWSPKSQSVAAVATALNIGLDTVVFVDDQEFERQEVSGALPEVRVAEPASVVALLDSPAFQLPVTDESRNRRVMYRQEEQRVAHLATYQGDYLAFLRENRMQVSLSRLTDQTMQRVYELAQRTNQMNFSGNRYSIDELRHVAADASLDTYVIQCSDRFGSYGIVGFAVVDRTQPRLLDLMFSCRVQSKRVEHGFLSWLLNQHRGQGQGDFLVNYRKSPKNGPSGAVFEDLGFQEAGTTDGISVLRFEHTREIPRESVVEILVKESE